MSTLDTLNRILTNVQNNKESVAKQIDASTRALGNATPEVIAAIDLLIGVYGPNVQVIGQTIGAKLQIVELEKATVDIDAMIASLQITLADEANVEAAETLIASGATKVSDPLPPAVGDSNSPAANDAAPVETPTVAPQTGDAGASEMESALLDGATVA